MLLISLVVALATFAALVVKRYLEFREAVKCVRNYPGFRTLISSFGITAYTFVGPPIPGVTIGGFPFWKRMYADFQYFGADIVSHISVLPTVRHCFYIADATAVKEVISQRAKFPKPVEDYKIAMIYGKNIVASEGEDWKRFRKVSAPAFSEPNNKFVWEETAHIMTSLFDDVWHNEDRIGIDHIVNLTFPIALYVIGAAGFGRRVSWKDDSELPPRHAMTFKDALHESVDGILAKMVLPDWFLRYNPVRGLRHVALAFDELEKHMLEMIAARRSSEKKEERFDLFTGLLDASDYDTDGSAKLTDIELLSNIFIFLVAGHETTANLLAFALALLALHQDEQEKVYQHIQSVIKEGGLPAHAQTYESSHALTYVLAVLYETLRMFPPVVRLFKTSAEDTTLATTNSTGERVIVPVPKGSRVDFHIVGLHYNPRYWGDPFTFKPSRFLGDWPRDAFMPFSGGARSCIGRRFSETEATVVLTMLLLRYKVDIKDEPQFAHETFEERKARILTCKEGITITLARAPIVFTKRQ